MTKFEQALALDVNDYKEKKGRFDYLSWPYAVQEFNKLYPEGTWVVNVNQLTGLPVFGNSDIGYMVHTTTTVDGLTKEQWYPVVDNRNSPIMSPTVFDINTSIQRCLVKNIALFGIGLYIYAGEDLPSSSEETPTPPPKKTKASTKTSPKTEEAKVEAVEEVVGGAFDWSSVEEDLLTAIENATTLAEVTKANVAVQSRIPKDLKSEFSSRYGETIRNRMFELKSNK